MGRRCSLPSPPFLCPRPPPQRTQQWMTVRPQHQPPRHRRRRRARSLHPRLLPRPACSPPGCMHRASFAYRHSSSSPGLQLADVDFSIRAAPVLLFRFARLAVRWLKAFTRRRVLLFSVHVDAPVSASPSLSAALRTRLRQFFSPPGGVPSVLSRRRSLPPACPSPTPVTRPDFISTPFPVSLCPQPGNLKTWHLPPTEAVSAFPPTTPPSRTAVAPRKSSPGTTGVPLPVGLNLRVVPAGAAALYETLTGALQRSLVVHTRVLINIF